MGKLNDDGVAWVSGKSSGSNCAALQTYGLTGNLFEVRYLTRKPHQAEFDVEAPLSSENEDCINRLSSIKWRSWYVSTPSHTDKPNRKRKESANDFKDLIPLVRIVAQKIHRPLPANVMLNDLIQDGMIGLLTAFSEHDASLGVPFRAFAENKIRWAIMDGLRAADWAGRSVRRRASKVAKTVTRLQALLSREPSKKEIADALEIHVDDIASILGNAHGYDFVRIDDAIGGETQDIPDSRMEPQRLAEQRETYSRAIAGLRTLRPNERRAIILRTMCDMSVLQAAAEMGVSESRVSQLCKKATEKLASYI